MDCQREGLSVSRNARVSSIGSAALFLPLIASSRYQVCAGAVVCMLCLIVMRDIRVDDAAWLAATLGLPPSARTIGFDRSCTNVDSLVGPLTWRCRDDIVA